MSKLQVQQFPVVLRHSGSLAEGASSLSGCLISTGYSVLRGLLFSTASLETASGIRVRQSTDSGSNWDETSLSSMVTNSGASAYQYNIYGNAVQVIVKMGVSASGTVRTLWQLVPIP